MDRPPPPSLSSAQGQSVELFFYSGEGGAISPSDRVPLACAGINICGNVTQMACKGSDEPTTDGRAPESESWKNLCPLPMKELEDKNR